MQARIYEQGNGFPDTGDFIAGRGDWDGGVFVVTGVSTGPIQTGDERGNWLLVEVEEADWFDILEGNECFPALCVPRPDWTQYLKGDPVSSLREVDVFDILDDMQYCYRDEFSGWLVQQRPDLVDTVQDVLAELRAVQS